MRGRFLAALGGRLGWTEGQVQTLAIGLAVAVLTAAVGIPPVLDAPEPASSAAAEETAGADVLATPGGEGEETPTSTTVAIDDDPVVAAPTESPPPAATGGGTALSELGPTPSGLGPTGSTGRPERSATSTLGTPGKNGKCGVSVRSIDNPRHPAGAEPQPVWIYVPTGAAGGSITGGRCGDSKRPALFVAHGFGQTDPVAYEELIEHLVSVGNVVVYPTYNVDDGERSTLEESHRVVDAGIVAAVNATPRIDTSRVGWWGHSHGGGMIPYLVRRGGARRWGTRGLWMSIVAQAYTQLVGAGDIPVPKNAEAMSVAFQHDGFADARLGIDVFESLVLPPPQKRHVTVLSGASGPSVADHGAPSSVAGQSDAVDLLLWRYADLLELCALHNRGCAADLSMDETSAKRAVVSRDPVDVGPYPALLAECDAGFGPQLNPRIKRCGETRV